MTRTGENRFNNGQAASLSITRRKRDFDAIDAAPNSFTVRVGAERFTTAKLVIAAGLGSRDLAPMVGLNMPVVPSRGQIIVTERLRPFLDYTCHTLRQTVEGTVMLGDSQEDAGFDISVGVPVLQDIAARNLAVVKAGVKSAREKRVVDVDEIWAGGE